MHPFAFAPGTFSSTAALFFLDFCVKFHKDCVFLQMKSRKGRFPSPRLVLKESIRVPPQV
jgi:hypothetical protein